MRWLPVLLLVSACSMTPLRQARQAGLYRQGPNRASTLVVAAVEVQVHDEAPLTGAAAPAIDMPPAPDLPTQGLITSTLSSLLGSAEDLGLTVEVDDVGPWDDDLPADLPTRLQALLGRPRTGALVLRVHVGRCPVDGASVPCVRSPDTALGYGPPAIDGLVFSRLKPASDGAFAKRVTVVSKAYTYRIDDASGAHWDAPFVGSGDTAEEQAADAIDQAVTAWMTVYAGRRSTD